MKILVAYDALLLRLTRWMVEWLEEWLSLSLRSLERCLLVASIGAALLWIGEVARQGHWMGLFNLVLIPMLASVTYVLWLMHRAPKTIRFLAVKALRRPRLFYQGIVLLFLLQGPLDALYDPCALWYLVAVVIHYVHCCGSDGEPGRRRKLALAKLKELFGAEWMPKPVGAQ